MSSKLQGSRERSPVFSLGVPGAFAGALEAAGFRDAREERAELTIPWKDDDDACAAMFDGGPAAYPWSLFAQDARAKVAGPPCVARPVSQG